MLLGHLRPCPEAVLGKKQYFPAVVNLPVKKKKNTKRLFQPQKSQPQSSDIKLLTLKQGSQLFFTLFLPMNNIGQVYKIAVKHTHMLYLEDFQFSWQVLRVQKFGYLSMIAVCSAFLTSFLAHDLTRSMLKFLNENPYQIPSNSPLWLLCKPEIQLQFISLLCQSNLRFQAKCSKMQGFAVLIGNQAKLCGFILIFQIYLEMEGDNRTSVS